VNAIRWSKYKQCFNNTVQLSCNIGRCLHAHHTGTLAYPVADTRDPCNVTISFTIYRKLPRYSRFDRRKRTEHENGGLRGAFPTVSGMHDVTSEGLVRQQSWDGQETDSAPVTLANNIDAERP